MASGTRRRKYLMARAAQKVALSPPHGIPFEKLVWSQSNVWPIRAGLVKEPADDIANCGLLQSLNAQPAFDIQTDGQRFQLLWRLLKQKWVARPRRSPASCGMPHRRNTKELYMKCWCAVWLLDIVFEDWFEVPHARWQRAT